MSEFAINNPPTASELWAGIGGHFDSLGQILNEFIDNSISNFIGNKVINRNIIITLKEKYFNGPVEIVIEDSGTGVKNLDAAFTLGSKVAGESPLNEHGFGLKHALASANPENDSWVVYSRTKENLENKEFASIKAPYKIKNYSGELHENENWPGQLNGTGTIICFTVTREMFLTLARGIRGGMTNFNSIADVLCEDIGFIYAGIIKRNQASISLIPIDSNGVSNTFSVGAVEPDWQDYVGPKTGTDKKDLGNGDVKIEYKFGLVNDKDAREPFNNETTRKYYKTNMSSSGVEIRINGRVLCYNLFKEIWGIEKHNSFNNFLAVLDLQSDTPSALPQTRTSKNGLREGDIRLESLIEWIKSVMDAPPKDMKYADHEVDMFEKLAENLKIYDPDPNKVIKTEKHVFINSGNPKDKVRIDLYIKNAQGITIYEGKKEDTTSKDVYQLRMYWDGLVYDGIKPDYGFLIAESHPDSVKNLISIVNTMKDANGNNYNFQCCTWKEKGIS